MLKTTLFPYLNVGKKKQNTSFDRGHSTRHIQDVFIRLSE